MAELPGTIAAVDLGSNSFHMVVARVAAGEPVVLDRLREQVQLASGLDESRDLDAASRARALECLQRFGQRIRELPGDGVRAVGTNTLRKARNARAFLTEAESALGRPIEVIAGREEARLIYLGVSHSLASGDGYRLVVDIGGGSTECILGERFEPVLADSLEMGCVHFSRRFFRQGAIRRGRFREAVLAGRLELRSLERRFKRVGWSSAVGSSGTIRAAEEVLRLQGWSPAGITYEGLDRLRSAMLSAGKVERLSLQGLKAERAPVFPGGVAILLAFFESLEIDRMDVSQGALREGLLYDLLGRLHHEDIRDRTIRLFQERYHVDIEQAARVERTALQCLQQVARAWELEDETWHRYLSWAANLHEIGLAVAYERHHAHGAYLVAHFEMPGFSRDDQEFLAALIGAHRRKIHPEIFGRLPERRRVAAQRLTVLLRLAVRLNRSRTTTPPPRLKLDVEGAKIRISPPQGWLERHPMTRRDLDGERRRLRALGFDLQA